MNRTTAVQQEIEEFIENWREGEAWSREGFLALYRHVTAMQGVELNFVGRPGVSFSLRPRGAKQPQDGFYAIIDVIDDDPRERWLSVCFYGEMINDPESRGEVIPGGLAGADAAAVAAAQTAQSSGGAYADAIAALVALGFGQSDAAAAVSSFAPEMRAEDMIAAALKSFAGR